MKPQLSIVFRNGPSSAKVIISTESDFNYYGENEAKDIPEFNISSQHVPVVENLDELSKYSDYPIVMYSGSDEGLSRILLLEETRYYLRVDGLTDDELIYLKRNANNVFFKSVELANHLYIMNTKGYVGKGIIDVTLDGESLETTFEVRSTKIEYLRDYPIMLRDVAEFSSLYLLDPKTPLYRNYNLVSSRDSTEYETFLVLEYSFDKLDLVSNYEYVRNNLSSELVKKDEEETTGSISNFDISNIVSMVQGSNLYYSDEGVIDRQYNPMVVIDSKYEDSLDTPENRLVKDLLLSIQSALYALEKKNAGNDYVRYRTKEMKEIVDNYLSDSWLKDVGTLSHIPFESTILQNRHGYSDLFSIYQILGMNVYFQQDEIEGLLKGHGKKIYELYELWCLIQLHNVLNKRCVNPGVSASSLERVLSKKGNSYSIDYDIKIRDELFKVRLFYNRTFEGKDESYSVKLRPDFTMLVEYNGCYIVNFDSKYKVKVKDSGIEVEDSKIEIGCWEYDIYKMHTYHDAIRKNLGSYVLYPGDNSEGWHKYVKKFDILYSDDDVVLPSVGAISLNPANNTRNLDSALEEIFNQIIKLEKTYSEGLVYLG